MNEVTNRFNSMFAAFAPYTLEEQRASEMETAYRKHGVGTVKAKFAVAIIRAKYAKLGLDTI